MQIRCSEAPPHRARRHRYERTSSLVLKRRRPSTGREGGADRLPIYPLGEFGAFGLNFAKLLDDFRTALLKVAEVQLLLGNFPLVSATDATN